MIQLLLRTRFSCGYSDPGDIIANFYDGKHCVSSAFVVGLAAGLGGLLLIIIIGLAIGLGCKSSKRKNKDVIEWEYVSFLITDCCFREIDIKNTEYWDYEVYAYV